MASAQVTVLNDDGSAPVQVGQGHSPTFSPDGTRLAFTRRGEIWLWTRGGEARRIDEVGVEMHGDRTEGGHPLDHAGDGAIGQRCGKAEHPGVDFGGDAAAELDGEGGIAQRQQAGEACGGPAQGLLPERAEGLLGEAGGSA